MNHPFAKKMLVAAGTLAFAAVLLYSLSAGNAQERAPGNGSSGGESLPAPKLRQTSTSQPGTALPSATRREITVTEAMVSSTDPIKLPAQDAAAITEMMVKKGYEVKAGDVICQMNDTESRIKKKIAEFERDAAKTKAESPHELQAARDGERVAGENYKANKHLNDTGLKAVSLFDLRRSEFEWLRAKAQIGVAETEAVVALQTQHAKEGQIEAAENEISRRQLRSPVDGVVVQLYKHVGEWAQPGDPVVEIVRMNRVEIEGWVLAEEASPAEVLGKPVSIYVELAGPENKGKPHLVKGTITFASPVLQGSGSNRQFRVATEVDNEQVKGFWVIQPGTEARMVIDVAAPAAKPPTPMGSKTSTKVEALKPNASKTAPPKEDATKAPAEKPIEIKTGETKAAETKSSETKPTIKTDDPSITTPKLFAPKKSSAPQAAPKTEAAPKKEAAPKTEVPGKGKSNKSASKSDVT